jgi:hypothetical protein
MPADLHASTYLVDSVDLAATGVALTHDGAGLWAGLTEDIAVSTTPGINGGLIVGGRVLPFTHSTMYLVQASTQDAVWASIRSLRRRCKPGRSVTLTRRMPDPEGGGSNMDQAATARRQTDRVSWLAPSAAVVDIDWLLTDGPWFGSGVTIASIAGTQSILGDTVTRRMTLTLAAGAARTVQNTTNGYWFTFGTTVPTGGVLVDVRARTAVAITGGTDMSGYLSWGKVQPLQLDPGSNTITVTAGSASVTYQPAYL